MRALDVWKSLRCRHRAFLGVFFVLVMSLGWTVGLGALGTASWSSESSTTTGSGSNLNGVSCVSSSSCMVVGYVGDKTLIESWRGSAWWAERSPDRGVTGNNLNGVSCVSSKSCVAVGNDSSDAGAEVPMPTLPLYKIRIASVKGLFPAILLETENAKSV